MVRENSAITFKTKDDIPPQNGKVVLVTGATGGLGYETALAIAGAGATVIVGGRNEAKGKEALKKIRETYPAAKVSFGKMDLGSLDSIRTFAKSFLEQHQVLDVLVNNAGIMAPPERRTTVDGFEIQFATNHLGHFLLTSLLLPALRRSESPRVVNVSSIAASSGKINLEDLNYEKNYVAWTAYEQSKLSNLLFTFELQRLSDSRGWGIKSLAAHPGVSRTDLISNGMGTGMRAYGFKIMARLFGQDVEAGALPQLLAATYPDTVPAGYYGPRRYMELSGPPGFAKVPEVANDLDTAKKLWDISCKMAGAQW